MKINILIAFLVMTLVSCSNKNESNASTDFKWNANDSNRIYSNTNGTSLSITNSIWHTTKQWGAQNVDGFVSVYLVISGSTNADKVTVRTFGDGVTIDEDIKIDLTRKFTNDTIPISFSHFLGTFPNDEFETKTFIKAYKGSDTLIVTMNSGKLRY